MHGVLKPSDKFTVKVAADIKQMNKSTPAIAGTMRSHDGKPDKAKQTHAIDCRLKGGEN